MADGRAFGFVLFFPLRLASLLSLGRWRRSADPGPIPQVSERIVIGVESHQMTDFSDMKDDQYPPSTMTFVGPDEKTLSPIEEV